MTRPLKNYSVPNFKGGYNSFPSSKTAVKDDEIPFGQNVVVTDVGSIAKRPGKARYGPQVASGFALRGGGVLKNSSYNALIVAAGTAWYKLTSNAVTALTGVTFTADKKTHFSQAFDKLYGANNTDALAYTSNTSTITSISSNGNVGDWPVFFNQRIYMTNRTFPDRIYYSNSYQLDLTTNPPTLTGFDDANMFNTNLSATPKKTAGYIVLSPGSGVEITRLFYDSQAAAEYLYAYTKAHGIWRINAQSLPAADGSIVHSVFTVVTAGGVPAGESVGKVANDQEYYGGDNIYGLGEQAQYQNVRRSTKSGRVRSEILGIVTAGKPDVAFGFYKDRAYYAYRVGSYNDRLIIRDVVLNAWSSPQTGINANFFITYTDDSGVEHFLAGSSNSADSYMYELETGTNDQGSAISAVFETKSFDCGSPGIVKRFAFIDVFYSTVTGIISYEVFADEVEPIVSDSESIGGIADRPVGIGVNTIGSFMMGADYDPNTIFSASSAQNGSFRIDCGFEDGKKVSVRFSNATIDEDFKINGMEIWHQVGSPFEQ